MTLTTSAHPATVPKLSDVPARKMPRLGWLEWTMILQTLLPAMMYIPGVSPFRFLLRILATTLPLVAWGAVAASGRRIAGGYRYAAGMWLWPCSVWLLLSIAHPTTNSPLAGLAQAMLNIALFCPAFWAANQVTDSRQVRRLIVVILLCNGASSLMGIAQVYRPDTFRPPSIPMLAGREDIESEMTVTTEDGLKYLRPPGLSDTPGGAALGGTFACLLGLAIAMTPVSWAMRVMSLGLAIVGLAVIFYSQVRFTLILLVVGILAMVVLLAMRRDWRKLMLLGVCTVVLAVGGIGWVMQSGGTVVTKRFFTLLDERSDTVYYNNRGKFVEYALTVALPEYPLGAGLGRFGTMNGYFGDPLAPPSRGYIWCETQIEGWIIDGGGPLLFGSAGAIITAMVTATSMALRRRDEELGYWAAVVAVLGLFSALSALGNMAFLSFLGLQFWILMGALFGADAVARDAARRSGSAAPRAAS